MFKTLYYNKFKYKLYVLDCKKKKLGRLSTLIVNILIGKYNIFYTPNWNNNNKVILLNINKIFFKKKKKYINYTGYPGGQKIKSFEYLLKNNPKKILLHSILGMIKNNLLKKKIKKNIYLYTNKEKVIINNKYIKLKL
ncbi:MAG: uL13 family ribosomal protein [Candidatus Shikimatogenerans sp. Tcar]|uniref:50S ribosomal protein L13 n=1 Tax=Candidatus Shikimatogenerans sp. Tcar TaxID=3158565 RepID=A0AAU7QS87_9FLAO